MIIKFINSDKKYFKVINNCMKIAIFFLKILLDAFRDTLKVCKYFNLVKLNNSFVVVKIFIIRFFYSFESIRNRIKSTNPVNEVEKQFIIDNNYKVKNIIEDLNEHGHSKIFNIGSELNNQIKEGAFLAKDFDLKKLKNGMDQHEIIKSTGETDSEYFNRLRNKGISRISTAINLNNKSPLSNFILSDEVLAVAKNYLNTNKISINATLFISTPLEISEKEKYENAQYYHWDNDFTKFLKLYLYLNDVDEDGGPHIFVPGTHKKKEFSTKLCRLYSDKNIAQEYSKNKKFVGKKGSMFFVDSYGLHKGEHPTGKSRLMLNVHFGRGKIIYFKNDLYIKI